MSTLPPTTHVGVILNPSVRRVACDQCHAQKLRCTKLEDCHVFQVLIAIGGHQDIRQLAGHLISIQGVDKGCELQLLLIASGNRLSKDTMVEEMALPLGKTRRMCISSTFLLR
ncbi:C6 transcription factor [Aspergillus luchuensis]|uniref:C6 transcription factor n=1 Tax=Aspergillus kawachii TaxID=1069201 RepID=A0A146FP53_ASPKA|nr:C6 transcription factor [Aspergillus luchuensis]